MSKIEKVLVTGKTHTTPTKPGDHNSKVNLNLSGTGAKAYAFEAIAAHPTAEQLFAGAWSACYISAVSIVASSKGVQLPADTAVDIEVDLGQTGDQYFLQARLTLSVPGLPLDIATEIAHGADAMCPYSKATKGNIDVALNVAV
ncbi:Ohr family peroxiredoxin [Pseudoduganella sp. RAF53_2]|uniref:Ohr family peroxiredoxin n=1 Tax=unclassified Pseudoduganella TaxID=2637179 RepID=UPI003F9A7A8A